MSDRTLFVRILCILFLIINVDDVFTSPAATSRACIIGAGFSGLGTARYMKEFGLNFTVFEATRDIGGIWRFEPRVGTDEDGLPTFPTSYKGMRTNSVIGALAFSGFPFPEELPSFISATCVHKYMQSFIQHFDLMKHIQFQSLLTKVERSKERWSITYMKTDTKKNVTEECDFLAIATGEYSAPHRPHFVKEEEFQGKIIHIKSFKDAEDYRNLRVLIVGAGPSAFDLLAQLFSVNSSLVHSHHFPYDYPKVPRNYKMKPDVKHFTSNGAVFVDNSTEEFDTVILCTGYRYNLPFLNYHSSGLVATNQYVMPLHNKVVNINQPSMALVGLGKTTINVVRDKQAHYAAALAAGQFKLPSQEEMFLNWLDIAKTVPNKNINIIGYQITNAYLQELLNGTDISLPSPVYGKMLEDDAAYWFTMFLDFHDYQYKVISDTEYQKTYKPTKEVCNIVV